MLSQARLRPGGDRDLSYEIAPVEHAHHQVLVRLAYRKPVAGVDQVETGLGIAIQKLRHRQRRVGTIPPPHKGHVPQAPGLLHSPPPPSFGAFSPPSATRPAPAA